MAKIVDGIKMSEVKEKELKAQMKAFNDAKLGVTCSVGKNPLGSAKNFVKAVESVPEEKQDAIPEAVADYYNLIVLSEEEAAAEADAPDAEADEPAAEADEPPAPKAKPSTKPKVATKPTAAPKAKPTAAAPKAKAPAKPKADKGPSNKFQVYKEWKKSKEKRTPAELFAFVEERVSLTTVRNWVSQWKNGVNFPAGVSAE